MQESGPGPLTPPPVPRAATGSHRGSAVPVFVFQNEPPKSYSHHQYGKPNNEQSSLQFDTYTTRSAPESIQMSAYANQFNIKQSIEQRYDSLENFEKRMNDAYLSRINREIPYRQYDLVEDSAKLRYGVPTSQLNERGIKTGSEDLRTITTYAGYDSVPKNQHPVRQHVRNDSRGSYSSFNFANSNNSTAQTIMESIYGPQAATKLLQNSQNYCNDLTKKNENLQSIEMTPFGNSNVFQDELNFGIHGNAKIQGLQRVSQYIQSLPDVPPYDSMSDQTQDQTEDEGGITPADNEMAVSPVPPPAPPDPPDNPRKNVPTTGERIFSALRSVTSQSYIDASEFYK